MSTFVAKCDNDAFSFEDLQGDTLQVQKLVLSRCAFYGP